MRIRIYFFLITTTGCLTIYPQNGRHIFSSPLPSTPKLPVISPLPSSFISPAMPLPVSSAGSYPIGNQTQMTSPVVSSAADLKGPETVMFSEEQIGAQGNWVKKREWLKQTKELDNEIVAMCDEITSYRSSFYKDKNEQADNILDDFYRKSGTERGNFVALLQTIDRNVHDHIDCLTGWLRELQSRTNSIDAVDAEFQLYDLDGKIATFKDELDQVHFDVETIVDMDNSITERLEAIDGYIKIAIDERQKAIEAVDFMFSIIDHEKARTKYYEVKGMYDRVKAIRDYVKQIASRDFESLIVSINSTIEKIQSQLQSMAREVTEIGAKIETSRRAIQAHNAAPAAGHTSLRDFLRNLLPF